MQVLGTLHMSPIFNAGRLVKLVTRTLRGETRIQAWTGALLKGLTRQAL